MKTGQILLQSDQINRENLIFCLEQQRQLAQLGCKKPIGEIFKHHRFISRHDINTAIKQSKGITAVDIPEWIEKKYKFLSNGVKSDILEIFSVTHLDGHRKTALQEDLKAAGIPVLDIKCEITDRTKLLKEFRVMSSIEKDSVIKNINLLESEPSNGQVLAAIIKGVFEDAVEKRASDIHIIRSSDILSCHISYRIDGIVRFKYQLTPQTVSSLMVRLKTESGMDISESKKPQDGRVSFTYKAAEMDMRFSCMPTHDGESMVIRVLNPDTVKSLKELYINFPEVPDQIQNITSFKVKTGGLMLITGATGSGKSTTMYGVLKDMDRYRHNILTVEDPVEHVLPGIKQTNINEHIGLTFANMLKYQVRHDPDVLVIGEMRDTETVEAALRAAESGHLVISTLHTIDISQGITRLVGMMPVSYRTSGMFVVANYLKAIINQKLVQKICSCSFCSTVKDIKSGIIEEPPHIMPETKGKRVTDHGEDDKQAESFGSVYRDIGALFVKTCISAAEELGIADTEPVRVPVGCMRCNYTGYYGRTVMPEAAFFPGDVRMRGALYAIFNQGNKEIDANAIINTEGVEYLSLKESAKKLIRAGYIDMMVAADVLTLNI